MAVKYRLRTDTCVANWQKFRRQNTKVAENSSAEFLSDLLKEAENRPNFK
jgi:hypothetical protein